MTIEPDEGYTRLSSVDICKEIAPNNEYKYETIESNGTFYINIDDGYDGISIAEFTVDVPVPDEYIEAKEVVEQLPVVKRITYDDISFENYDDYSNYYARIMPITVGVEEPGCAVEKIIIDDVYKLQEYTYQNSITSNRIHELSTEIDGRNKLLASRKQYINVNVKPNLKALPITITENGYHSYGTPAGFDGVTIVPITVNIPPPNEYDEAKELADNLPKTVNLSISDLCYANLEEFQSGLKDDIEIKSGNKVITKINRESAPVFKSYNNLVLHSNGTHQLNTNFYGGYRFIPSIN